MWFFYHTWPKGTVQNDCDPCELMLVPWAWSQREVKRSSRQGAAVDTAAMDPEYSVPGNCMFKMSFHF